MLRPLPTSAAGLLLAASLTAQNQVHPDPGRTPVFAGVYRVAEGRLDSTVPGPQTWPALVFNNSRLDGYYAVQGAGLTWIDEGALADRSTGAAGAMAIDQVHAFEFAWCSTEPDPTGDAGSFLINLYDEGTVTGGPVPGATSCSYTLSGLPLGGPNGELRCWVVQVDLQGAECSTDVSSMFRTEEAAGAGRLLNWSITAAQDQTGPMLADGGYRVANTFLGPSPNGLAQYTVAKNKPASFYMRFWGPSPGILTYRPTDGSANTLQLSATSSAGGTQTTFSWNGSKGGGVPCWLIASTNPTQRNLGGAGWSLLVDPNALIAPTPIAVTGNSMTVNAPPSSLTGYYFQVVCGHPAGGAMSMLASNGACFN